MTNETEKCSRIRDIINSENEVKKVVILYNLTQDEAYTAEAALLNMMNYLTPDALTNLVSGHHADSAMTVEQLERIYGAEELSENNIHHNLLVIKINSLYKYNMNEKNVMDCARGHWIISERTAQKADYLVAVYHGLIVGIYENMEWHPSGIETAFYPRLSNKSLSLKNRKYCTCTTLGEEISVYKAYMNKSIAHLVNNIQNPVSYIWGRK